MKFRMFLPMLVGLIVVATVFSQEDTLVNRSQRYDRRNDDKEVLIVSTLDGNLHGIDVADGGTLWTMAGDPLVSQSLSNLEFFKEGVRFRLIPSLEGQLYVLEVDGDSKKGLHALPITADALFTATFQLSTDSLLVGGKEQRVTGFDPFSGKEKYRCSKEGCQQAAYFRGGRGACDLLVVRRVSHVVRAVDLDSGEEKWNFSVGQDELLSGKAGGSRPWGPLEVSVNGEGGCNLNDGPDVDADDLGPSATGWSFDVEGGTVQAASRSPFKVVRWRKRLSSALSRVWLLRGGSVRPLALFPRDARSRLEMPAGDCPSTRALFLGTFRNQMYVQLEDGGGKGAPGPLYIALQGREEALPGGVGGAVGTEVQPRYRVSKVTRVGGHSHGDPPHGFFRPATQNPTGTVHRWLSTPDGTDECYVFGSDPLVVRFGSFLFQKVALACLLAVVGHLLFGRLYLPLLQAARLREQARHGPMSLGDGQGPNEDGLPPPGLPQAPPPPPAYASRYETDYEHVRCLGKGAFGVVFEARHRVDRYHYAVKRVRVRHSPRARERLLQEVQAFAHLEHPGIVRYYQAWFELPPRGWQERRDRDLGLLGGGSNSEGPSEGSGGSGESLACADCEGTGWSDQAGLEDGEGSRGDSLIIFDRSVSVAASMSPREEDDDEATSSGVFARSSSTGGGPGLPTRSLDASLPSSRPGPLGDAPGDCSHIYLFISMHLYSGTTLQHRLQQAPRPPRHALLATFAQIVDAVAYLHANGLMHRDLKPSNILFDHQDHIRIADFGLATPLLRTRAAPPGQDGPEGSGLHTSNVGTELYMSPEQQRGCRYDQKVDMFALGIIFLELMLPLATGMERAVVLGDARRLRFSEDLRARLPEEVELASQLLRPDPARRPGCEEVLGHRLLAAVVDEVRPLPRVRAPSSC